MKLEVLPEMTQALYAELMDQAVRARAEAISLPEDGSFVSKKIGAATYWYFQRMEGRRRRQIYLGAESTSLLEWIEEVQQHIARLAPDDQRRRELVSMVIAGGGIAPLSAFGKVLQVLSSAKIFDLGGMLVGTQAFNCFGNLLGVRFNRASTMDVDIAHDPRITISLQEKETSIELLDQLRNNEPGFFAVPSLDPRNPSTSFKVRGRDLRVDFLTPRRGRSNEPVFLEHFGVAATPLEHLGYLMERPTQTIILTGKGLLAHVPSPARFAFHKLWMQRERPISEMTKTRKDQSQAAVLLGFLSEESPEEITEAWRGTKGRRGMRSRIRNSLGGLEPEVASRVRGLMKS